VRNKSLWFKPLKFYGCLLPISLIAIWQYHAGLC
jgi:hypothetical protein